MIRDIRSATVWVNDGQKSLEFYRDVLGFEMRTDAPTEPESRWIEVAPPGSPILLNLIHGYGGWEPEHVGKATGVILSADDVRQTVEALRAKGVTITMAPESFEWGTNAAFADPDGNSFVIDGP